MPEPENIFVEKTIKVCQKYFLIFFQGIVYLKQESGSIFAYIQ
jgi:hypothetical protein